MTAIMASSYNDKRFRFAYWEGPATNQTNQTPDASNDFTCEDFGIYSHFRNKTVINKLIAQTEFLTITIRY